MRKALFALCCMLSAVCVSYADVPQNPRSASGASGRTERAQSSDVVNRSATTTPRAVRTAVVGSRTTSSPQIKQSRSAVSTRSGISQKVHSPIKTTSARSATVSRSATTARATAVFSDLSKLGTGYNTCREAYNTCMDQFCAGVNNTYRRCICSDKYRDFSDMEIALDEAKTMLQSFSDNNLANVSLTAEEVTAINSATAGEAAASMTDTSAAAQMLSEIGDLLSGKTQPAQQTTSKLDFSNLDFSSAMEDIWSGSDTNIFNTDNVENLASLDGDDLYNEVDVQCTQLATESCASDATLQMVRSAYGLLISQDCQTYSNSIDSQKEQVTQKVREANQLLRDARLEEYRTSNSASMNECIANVRNDILDDSACGENFNRCLDFTGLYIDAVTGDPIYSPRLFQLADQIKLENTNASENQAFLAGLDSYKNRATDSLNSCRDDATAVWNAFLSQALIEISQAQDKKLQEIKDECVMTMKDCYDSTTDALNSFDDTQSQRTTALSAQASAAMCKDKVIACAALYTPDGGVDCKFDSNNKITNADACGLRELMNFVTSVDNVRIAEGCQASLESYVSETCAPAVGDTINESPYGCRLISPEKMLANLQTYAKTFCMGDEDAVLDSDTQDTVNKVMNNIRVQLSLRMQQLCEDTNGSWISNPNDVQGKTQIDLDPDFVSDVFGGLSNFKSTVDSSYNLVVATIEDVNYGGATDAGRSGLVPRAATTPVSSAPANNDLQTADFQMDISDEPATNNQSNTTSSNNIVQGSVISANFNLANLDRAIRPTSTPKSIGWGLCLYNSVSALCSQQNELTGTQGYAVYNSGTNTCELRDGWYKARCESIETSGYWDTNTRTCYW